MFAEYNKVDTGGQILLIAGECIVPNPNQPRRQFDYAELKGLAESIEHNGILQPLTVRRSPDQKGIFELISGERRLRAARLAGMTKVPCILIDTSAQSSAVFSLIENMQRQDLNFFEEAQAIAQLIDDYALSQEEAAQRLGKAPSTLSNKLRLLKLPPDVRASIEQENLTERHARALLRIQDDGLMREVLAEIISRHLNVAETERLVERRINRPARHRQTTIRAFKDVRIFVNTINNAVDTMRKAGIDADAQKQETGEYIEYIVRIPKTAKPTVRKMNLA